MDLTQLANLGEFIGGVAVLVTLIYLAAQIRQNTSAIKVSSYRNAKGEFNRVNGWVAADAELAEILDKGLVSMEELSATERVRLGRLLQSYANIWEMLFHEMRDAAGHEEFWEAEERTIRHMAANAPGFRAWWSTNPYGGTTAFRDYVDRLLGTAADASSSAQVGSAS